MRPPGIPLRASRGPSSTGPPRTEVDRLSSPVRPPTTTCRCPTSLRWVAVCHPRLRPKSNKSSPWFESGAADNFGNFVLQHFGDGPEDPPQTKRLSSPEFQFAGSSLPGIVLPKRGRARSRLNVLRWYGPQLRRPRFVHAVRELRPPPEEVRQCSDRSRRSTASSTLDAEIFPP